MIAQAATVLAGSGVNIQPNKKALPGIDELMSIVGSILTLGLVAAVAGMAISGGMWALSGWSSNPQMASRGKVGLLVAFAAAAVCGAANYLCNFGWGIGTHVH